MDLNNSADAIYWMRPL